MKNKNLPVVSISKFTHCKIPKHFVAECSELGIYIFSAFYDDAADVGFSIINEKTNTTIKVVLEEKQTQGDEVTGWVFVPTLEDIRRNPKLRGYKFVVFND